MDGKAAIEINRQALLRILAGLVAMAGLRGHAFFVVGDAPSRGWVEDRTPTPASTLSRSLYLAVLRLLRPAESAARRLIVAAARGVVVTLPPAYLARLRPAPLPAAGKGFVRIRLAGLGLANLAPSSAATPPGSVRTPLFPLLDPLRRPFRATRFVARHGVPRLSFLGPDDPPPAALPQPRSADDRIDAARLVRRMAALAGALDDLPRQARRFARWKARRDAGLVRRLGPLRMGRPPGARAGAYVWRPGEETGRRRRVREVDDVLAHAHALACHALEYPDTS